METENLPDWLVDTSAPDPLPRYPTTKEARELQESTFLSMFERVIEGVEVGVTVTSIVRDDPRQIDLAKFMSWVRRDPERMKRFEEAKENGMLLLEDKLMEVADGTDSAEDVQRSKLRADTLRWIMQSWNRRRYGRDDDKSPSFSGGVTVVIGNVESPYLKREPLTLESS